jgi:phosphoribosylaminoimidazole-succinocarboxamide synthase
VKDREENNLFTESALPDGLVTDTAAGQIGVVPMKWTRGEQLYSGKAKSIYATHDDEFVIMEFKDDATAFNGVKHALIGDKGRINCAITVHIFEQLARQGVPSHMVEQLSETDLLCHRVEIVPVEVVVRNVIAGSLAKRYGKKEGDRLETPMLEYFYKSDELNDPLMTEDHAIRFGWAKKWELECMCEQALAINTLLVDFWGEMNVDLVDFKLEFGRHKGRIVLADEITPDGSRLWERGTMKRFDKDVFRRDLGDLSTTYRQLYERIFGEGLKDA